jgi:hypothetical protein
MRALMLWACMSVTALAGDQSNDPAPVYDMAPGRYVLSVLPVGKQKIEYSCEACRLDIDKAGWQLTLTEQHVRFAGSPGLRKTSFKVANVFDDLRIHGVHTGPDEMSGVIGCECELIATFVLARHRKQPHEITTTDRVMYFLGFR